MSGERFMYALTDWTVEKRASGWYFSRSVGYYIRGSAESAWALLAVDHHYEDEIVVDGLSYEDAVALYWRKLEELIAEKTARGAAVADEVPLNGDIAPRRHPRQLALKF